MCGRQAAMSAFLLCVPFLFHALLPHDTRDADGPAESPPSHTFALGVSCWLTSFSTCFSELHTSLGVGGAGRGSKHWMFKNNFIEVQFAYSKIHPFSVYMIFSKFRTFPFSRRPLAPSTGHSSSSSTSKIANLLPVH